MEIKKTKSNRNYHFRNIAKLRHRDGITQTDLANVLGVKQQSVARWENGVVDPSITTLQLMADIFDCSIDTLAGLAPIEDRAPSIAEKLLEFKGLVEGTLDRNSVDAKTLEVFDSYKANPDGFMRRARAMESLLELHSTKPDHRLSDFVDAVFSVK
jgi:transcriptional regulator with XRE-family HTH domain